MGVRNLFRNGTNLVEVFTQNMNCELSPGSDEGFWTFRFIIDECENVVTASAVEKKTAEVVTRKLFSVEND
jgi:hypothetical protein